MKKKLLFLLAPSFLISCGADNSSSVNIHTKSPQEVCSIIVGSSGKQLRWNELINEVKNYNNIIIGEEHYVASLQKAQSQFINDIVSKNKETQLNIGWEFFHIEEKKKVKKGLELVKSHKKSSEEFLVEHFSYEDAKTYAPVIDTVVKWGGDIVPVNISRERRKTAVQEGLGALPSFIVPDNFEVGGDLYFKRFASVMGSGHIPTENLKPYFLAQSLTDDVMAVEFLRFNPVYKNFLIVGSFHSDYGLGAVSRMKDRKPDASLITIKFVKGKEKLESLRVDKEYGVIADYIIGIPEDSKNGCYSNPIN